LGAGRLRAAFVCSDAVRLRIVPLGDWTLAASIASGAPIGQVDSTIEAALADEPHNSADEGDE
jgi:hypothetical protein